MNNFPTFSAENMGGLVDKFKFSTHKNISFTVTNNIISEELTFEYLATAIYDTLNFDEKQNSSAPGESWKTVITGFVPKLTAEYLQLFHEMVKQRFVVKITDNNNSIRICGLPNKGMKFSFSQQSSETPQGLNGFKFQFEVELPTPSPFYQFTE
jgi:hypothetical protein